AQLAGSTDSPPGSGRRGDDAILIRQTAPRPWGAKRRPLLSSPRFSPRDNRWAPGRDGDPVAGLARIAGTERDASGGSYVSGRYRARTCDLQRVMHRSEPRRDRKAADLLYIRIEVMQAVLPDCTGFRPISGRLPATLGGTVGAMPRHFRTRCAPAPVRLIVFQHP